MSDARYNTELLRQGGQQHRKAADAADSAANHLHGRQIHGGHFGDVGPAAALAGALGHAQSEHAKGAKTASENRTNRGHRADVTADGGDQLTAATTQIARRGVPDQHVANGM